MSQISDLFEHVLNFGPDWQVTNVEVDDASYRVELHVEFTGSKAPCPDNGQLLPIYDHREQCRWRHLNMMQYQTWIICSLPRVKDADGNVKTVKAPWADANQRFTFWFEAMAIELAQLTKSPTKTAEFLGSSYDVITGIIGRAVRRGLERRTAENCSVGALAIDEKAFRAGHQYIYHYQPPEDRTRMGCGTGLQIRRYRRPFEGAGPADWPRSGSGGEYRYVESLHQCGAEETTPSQHYP